MDRRIDDFRALTADQRTEHLKDRSSDIESLLNELKQQAQSLADEWQKSFQSSLALRWASFWVTSAAAALTFLDFVPPLYGQAWFDWADQTISLLSFISLFVATIINLLVARDQSSQTRTEMSSIETELRSLISEISYLNGLYNQSKDNPPTDNELDRQFYLLNACSEAIDTRLPPLEKRIEALGKQMIAG